MLNCDNSTVLRIILLVKDILNILKIAVPILLIVMCMLDIVKLVAASNLDKSSNTFKKVGNRILAAFVFFLVPTLVDIALQLVNVGSITVSTCWINANKNIIAKLQKQEEKEEAAKEAASKKAQNKFDQNWQKKQLTKRTALEFAKKVESTKPKGEGILIIAGHSYSPECLASDDCRPDNLTYEEPKETRSLAISLKKALTQEGINAVIANQILVGDENDEKMNASFYGSRQGKGTYADTFKELEKEGFWKNFKHVIEFHFNAADGNAKGTLLVTSGGKTNEITALDNKIIDAMAPYTGGKRSPWGFQSNGQNANLGDWEYFVHGLSVPMTYIEVEFYDNVAAMQHYKSNQEKIATAIAKVLKNEGF